MNTLKHISENMAEILWEIPEQTVIRGISVLALKPSMPPMAFFPLNERITEIFHAHFLDRISLFKADLIGITVIYSYDKKQVQVSEPERDKDLIIYTMHLPIHQITASKNLALEYLKLIFEGISEIFSTYYGISETEINPIYQQLVQEIITHPELRETLVEF